MSRHDFIPDDDANYAAWIHNFAQQASLNAAALNLSTAQVEEIQELAAAYQTSFQASIAARAAASSAVQQKNFDRQRSASRARQFTRIFKADPEISSALLALLGVVNPTHSGPLVPVTELTVVGLSEGSNLVQWNRSANGPGTMFIVEYQTAGEDRWNLAAVVGSTRFNHMDQMPGEETWYRITATRAGRNGTPCAPVVVYGQSHLRRARAA